MASSQAPPTTSPPGASPNQVQAAIQQQASDPAPPPDVAPCAKPLTWVEFRLLDMEGNPVSGKRYRAKLPGGAVKEGSLDQSGRVRFDGIEPGTATISYLEYDQEAWERI